MARKMSENRRILASFLGRQKTLLFASRIFPKPVILDFLVRKSVILGVFVKMGHFWPLRTPIFTRLAGPGCSDSSLRTGSKKTLIWGKCPKRVKRPKNGLCVHLFSDDMLDLGSNPSSQETAERERCILYLKSREIRRDFSENLVFDKKIDARKGQKSTFSSRRRFWLQNDLI